MNWMASRTPTSGQFCRPISMIMAAQIMRGMGLKGTHRPSYTAAYTRHIATCQEKHKPMPPTACQVSQGKVQTIGCEAIQETQVLQVLKTGVDAKHRYHRKPAGIAKLL